MKTVFNKVVYHKCNVDIALNKQIPLFFPCNSPRLSHKMATYQ